MKRISFCLAAIGLILTAAASRADEPLDFNRDIRPILAENCFYCHGQDANKRQAELRLDVRQIALDSGAITPSDPSKSALIERIHSTDAETQMPPPKSNRRLSDDQKKLLQRWITEGANYATHWAYVTPTRPAEPKVENEAWVRNPIDRFILSKLDAHKLKPSPEADRATLIKRLYIDLIGLPPTPEEVDAFLNDQDPSAYEKVVDHLLQSEHYGERMALPWLDAARYADSNGFQQDGDTWQWIWRDWVVKALNDDLPFDQFTTWQLAGDLLPNATLDQKIASGFNRNHLLNGEGGAIPEEQRFVNLFDRVDTTATTWLGLTMACAQCHDHKYDPITQRDYYSLMDAFNHVPETGVPQFFSSRIRVGPTFVEIPTEENNKKIADFEAQIAAQFNEAKPSLDIAYEGWRLGLFADGKPFEGKGLAEPLSKLLQKPDKERTDDEKKQIESDLRKHFDEKVRKDLKGKIPQLGKIEEIQKQLAAYKADQIPRVMIMSDAQARDTAILDRGEYLKPTEKVTFATPAFLPPQPEGAPKNRLGLAQWLVSADHPLTARVQVNRMWQYFFGTGLVKTAEDFGVQSEYPLHGPLLDWLAVEFRENGWSMKKMHRLIVTSAAFRQSSRVTKEQYALDAENRLCSRASRFRMPSMILRDWALTASGLVNSKIGGAPVYPYQPGDVWEALAITKERDFTYPASHGEDLYRRSLYTFWRRTVFPTNMFDAANRQTCRVRNAVTSTPLHALTTLNDPTWVEAARTLAQKSYLAADNLEARLAFAFRQVLCRKPTSDDLARLHRAYNRQLEIYKTDEAAAKALLTVGESKRDEKIPVADHAALTAVCLALFNLDEALTRE